MGKASRRAKDGGQSPAPLGDETPLTHLGPNPNASPAMSAVAAPVPAPKAEATGGDGGASVSGGGGSTVLITVAGAVSAVALILIAIACLVMLPIGIVEWLGERPPAAGVLFAAAHCVNDAGAARILSTSDVHGLRTLAQCIVDASDANSGPNAVPGFDSRLSAARAATNAGDLAGAEVALREALDAVVAHVRDKLDARTAAAWAPMLRVIASAAERKYTRARAVPAGSPAVESIPSAVAGFGASAATLRHLRLPAAPGAVTQAAATAAAAAAADGSTAAAATLQFAGFPSHADYPEIHTEALAGVDGLHGVMLRAGERYDASQRQRIAEITTTSILLAAAAAVCIAAAVALILLARRYSAVEEYRRVIRADFEVADDSPRAIPRPAVLRAFSLAAAKFSVLDTSPDDAVDKESSQLVLHLMRAKSTLAALRPFVPAFTFAPRESFEAFGRLYPRLDMASGLTKDTAGTVVVIGLRDFNNNGATLASLPTFVAAIQGAAEANRGIAAQVTPTHAILVFKSKKDDEMEGSSVLAGSGRGGTSASASAGRAIQAAFSVLASGVQLQGEDPDLSISIAVSHGCVLHGPVTTVSSRSYSIVSHTVTTAVHLEGLCRQLGACILCDSETAAAVDESVLSRPVWMCPSRMTNVHEVIMPLDALNDGAASPETQSARSAVRDRVVRWQQCFDKYEEAITSMAHDKVEEASADLQAFRQFVSAQTGSSDSAEDIVFRRVAEHLRRLMSDLKI